MIACAFGARLRDLAEVVPHRLRVGARHDHGRPGAAFGTDSAKQIGRFGAQIGQSARPCAAPCPAPCAPVLLAEAALILKPDFYQRLAQASR
jgi:hypothetical protein